jgi:hypothetical protein
MLSRSGMFSYEPLQKPMDIRLLKLRSGGQNETIQCSLSHSSLASHPYYHAVSYTWGSPGDVSMIELNGVTHAIQANLFEFLQQLRFTYGSVTLWVDALCINQNDLVEKGIQVPLMGLIYSRAKSVLVWLGPQADKSEEYFDYCNRKKDPDRKPFNTYRQSLRASDKTTTSISAAVASLQRRTYWTRTWIIQEIILASDIHIFCGDRSTHWPSFFLGMPEDDTENQAIGMRNPTHPFGKLLKLRNIATRLTLRQLLFQCHTSKCSEPRDLIYGLLNITNESPDKILPDYNCSLETLFLQTMGACPQVGYDGIPCLLFCDSIATRLGLELEKVPACANNILQSSPLSNLAKQLASRSYPAKLKRFGRFVIPTTSVDQPSLHMSLAESKVQQRPKWYTVREIPGTKSLRRLCSFCIPEATDMIFLLDFESPKEAVHHLACICRPVHYNANEEGVIPHRVVGLGIIPQHREEKLKGEITMNVEREAEEICELLFRCLDSLNGLAVTDITPGYFLQVMLLELVSLCMFARRANSFVPWDVDNIFASEHWQWSPLT